MTARAPLLEVSGISKRFGGLVAVRDLSLEMARGEVLGLIGPNGAGKTTAFNLLSGFLTPDQGEVRFDGHPLAGLKPRLVSDAEKLPGSRVLDGQVTGVQQAIGTPKARAAAAKYLSAFADDVKKSGFIKKLIDSNGVRGVSVAP